MWQKFGSKTLGLSTRNGPRDSKDINQKPMQILFKIIIQKMMSAIQLVSSFIKSIQTHISTSFKPHYSHNQHISLAKIIIKKDVTKQ
jgi:hypothetical protein